MVPNLCVGALRAKDDANAEASQPVMVHEYLTSFSELNSVTYGFPSL